MIGRETMPDIFGDLGVLNYAQSSLASYRHDLELVKISDLVVTAGSGVALLPDCMGRSLVYLDSWHLAMPMASPRSVVVPALVIERATGRMLSFKEQLSLYLALEDHGDEVFPTECYKPRNAAPDEVLEAVREALDLRSLPSTPLSARQLAFRRLDGTGLLGLSMARVSEYFVQRHVALLGESRSCVEQVRR
jgi:putative glycosyltransferase (TIGR04372 family)